MCVTVEGSCWHLTVLWGTLFNLPNTKSNCLPGKVFPPNLWLQNTLLQETLVSVKVQVSPYFLFIFCGCWLFLWLYLSCLIIFYDSTFHIWSFFQLLKKSSVSFRQTLVKFFHFTSFSRPVFFLVAKGSSLERRTWMAKHWEGGNLNLNLLLDQIYHKPNE